MGVIEGAWIVEIMRRPNPPVQLDTLAVAQYWRLFAVADVQADANARTGLQLEGKLIAIRRNGRGLDHAAGKDQCGGTFGIQFRPWRHAMSRFHQSTRRHDGHQAADARQHACPPPQAHQRQDAVRGNESCQLAGLKRKLAREQDSRGDSRQRQEKGIAQEIECRKAPLSL